jgi:hypothetical protein
VALLQRDNSDELKIGRAQLEACSRNLAERERERESSNVNKSLRIQSVPQRKHITIVKIYWSLLFKQIIAVYSDTRIIQNP